MADISDQYSLKLYYFNIAAKGEPIRLALKYLNIPFEDYRFSGYKEFLDMKASGELPFGQVPALKITEKSSGKETLLAQSGSILRFIGRLKSKNDFYPADPVLASVVDAIIDQEADAFASYRTVNYKDRNGFKEFNEEQQQHFKDVINQEVIPPHLQKIVKLLKNGQTGWLAGTQHPTIADIFWGSSLQAVKLGWTGVGEKVFDDFPEINQFIEKFLAIDEVAEYYKNTEFKIWW